MTADALTASPGQTVNFTVFLSGEADGTEEFTITSTGGGFQSLPTVTVPLVGLSIVTFSGVVSQTSSRTSTVTVSDGTYSASTRLLIGGL